MTLKAGKRGEQIEDLQREIPADLYGEMLDISEVDVRGRRRENVGNLYGKMADFSDHLLGVGRMVSAGVC